MSHKKIKKSSQYDSHLCGGFIKFITRNRLCGGSDLLVLCDNKRVSSDDVSYVILIKIVDIYFVRKFKIRFAKLTKVQPMRMHHYHYPHVHMYRRLVTSDIAIAMFYMNSTKLVRMYMM